MTVQSTGAPGLGVKHKRVMIAILLSLLFHAGIAGSASVVYWLDTDIAKSDTPTLTLALQEAPGLIAPPGTSSPPGVVQPVNGASSTIADTLAPVTQPAVAQPSQPQAPPRTPTSRDRTESLIVTETRQAPPAREQDQPALDLHEPETVRTASVLEHMLVQHMLTNPDLSDTAIRITPLAHNEVDIADSATQHRTTLVPKAMQLPRQHHRLETEIESTRVYSHASTKETAFSAYAHFIDRWDNDVYLSNDQIIGDFHVNSRIKLANAHNSQPLIHGRLTIGVDQFLTREFHNEAAFLQGVESGVGMIPMDPEPLLALMNDIHEETEIHYFQSHVSLTFLSDGTVLWQSLEDEAETGLIATSEQPIVFINEGRNRFEVSGEISGHFLVYSPHQIVVTGHLTYLSDFTDSFTINGPMLGLVSRRSVEIASRSTTGSGDLRIDAAIYAARRFSVRRYDDTHQGTLHIFGSLAAGSMSATEPRFTTLIEKDQRLDEIRPPGFPLTGQTVLAEWDGIWREQHPPSQFNGINKDTGNQGH